MTGYTHGSGQPIDGKQKSMASAIYVTLDLKSSLKSLGNICINIQQYIVWVKRINFPFMPEIIRILSKDHVP